MGNREEWFFIRTPAMAQPSSQELACACAGAKGPLVEEEARLFRLRQEVEGEAREEFQRARLQLEDEARTTSSGKLCATPFGVDVVGITEVIALTGALVGGQPPGPTCLPPA